MPPGLSQARAAVIVRSNNDATATANSLPLLQQPQFRWYIAGQANWYASWGVRHVLFPWLVVVVLHESPDRVGIAQMAVLLPNLFLLLIGGAVADRSDLRRLLLISQAAALLPPLGLAALMLAGYLSYPIIVVYGLLLGLTIAFVNPARDTLMSRLAGRAVQRAVTISTGLQFGCQIVGVLLAGYAAKAGAPLLLLVQAGFIAAALLATWRLAPVPSRRDAHATSSHWHEILDGVRVARTLPLIGPIVVLMVAMGFTFMGWFLVILPVSIRDLYGGSAPELALANMCFMGGTVLSTLWLLRIGHVRRAGRGFVAALGVVALLTLITYLRMPVEAYYLCVLLFGAASGLMFAMSRSLIQEASPETHRARILSLFQLGYLGAAPMGALAMGYLAELTGARQATLAPGLLLAVILLWRAPGSGLWGRVSH